MVALAASGRWVSLDELALWRKNGLLPSLASYGPKTPIRAYYWCESDILARAELVYDTLRKHGRNEAVTISLWLHGFEVPLSRVRRAWLHRTKQMTSARIRSSNGLSRPATAQARTLPDLLLALALHTAVSIECIPGIALPVLRRAAAALGYGPGIRDAETLLYWQTAMTMLLALGSSDVISSASDGEMLGAQRHLHVALIFLSGYCRDENPAAMVEALGPALFLFILALFRSGQHSTVQAVMDRIVAAPSKSAVPRQAAIQEGAAGFRLMPASV